MDSLLYVVIDVFFTGHSDGGGFSKYSTLSRMFYLQDILTEVDSLLYVVTDVLFTGHSDGGRFSTLRCHGCFIYRIF